MIGLLTERLRTGHELGTDEVHSVCDLLLDEAVPVAERAAFLEALHDKGETPAEITAFVENLLARAVRFPLPGTGCIDVCGTGGDHAGFFNVSTASMFVTAAAGVPVVKHGNRGITSKCGGADVLEALGVRVDLPPESAAAALESAGCCFLFAPNYHPAFKAVAPVRKLLAEQGKRSVFNMLGPLLNPAKPGFQLAGVFNELLLPVYGAVFRLLGRSRAWAVHGTGPNGIRLDEISPSGATSVFAIEGETTRAFEIALDELPFDPIDPIELAGGDARQNAAIIEGIFSREIIGGPRAVVQLNAAAALVVAGRAPGLRDGWNLAAEAINSGAARDVLARLRTAH